MRLSVISINTRHQNVKRKGRKGESVQLGTQYSILFVAICRELHSLYSYWIREGIRRFDSSQDSVLVGFTSPSPTFVLIPPSHTNISRVYNQVFALEYNHRHIAKDCKRKKCWFEHSQGTWECSKQYFFLHNLLLYDNGPLCPRTSRDRFDLYLLTYSKISWECLANIFCMESDERQCSECTQAWMRGRISGVRSKRTERKHPNL